MVLHCVSAKSLCRVQKKLGGVYRVQEYIIRHSMLGICRQFGQRTHSVSWSLIVLYCLTGNSNIRAISRLDDAQCLEMLQNLDSRLYLCLWLMA